MFKKFFQTPLYNALIWLIGFLGGSVGWAIIVLTILVKILLAPLTLASFRSQMEQKKLQPEISRIREQYPDKAEQSQKIMELYKDHKTNPFSGCVLVLVQLPIILGLYYVFLRGGLPVVDTEILYQGISSPENINMIFLGVDLGAKSVIFAVIAGLTQYIQITLSPAFQNISDQENTDTSGDMLSQLGPLMQKQMKFAMPIIIFMVSMAMPAAVALYWITNNLMTTLIERVAFFTQKESLV